MNTRMPIEVLASRRMLLSFAYAEVDTPVVVVVFEPEAVHDNRKSALAVGNVPEVVDG